MLEAQLDLLGHQQSDLLATQVSHRVDGPGGALGAAKRWVARRFALSAPVRILPRQQIVGSSGARLRVTGSDPQLLLAVDGLERFRGAWAWLELDISSAVPIGMELYLDVGHDFSPHLVAYYGPHASGLVRIPFYAPLSLQRLRLDPVGMPEFQVNRARIVPSRLDLASQVTHLPSRALLERLVAADRPKVRLQAVSQVVRDPQSGYTWRCDGNDPHFLLDPTDGHIPRAGWHMLEARIRASTASGTLRLYFDYGRGFNEADSVVIPWHADRLEKRLYRIRQRPRAIRVDPCEVPMHLQVDELRFAWVRESFAVDRMIKRIRNRHREYSVFPETEIRRFVEERARKRAVRFIEALERVYETTFSEEEMSYESWISRNEGDAPSAQYVEAALSRWQCRPSFSVLIPVYNTDPVLLRKCLDSVLEQTYPHWELCVADDASPRFDVREILKDYAAADPRIKITYRESNGHISRASNSALDLATGDFVALLDHDDELAPNALYYVAAAIQSRPDAVILYSDEDKIDLAGVRRDPHFKPDWNQDLLYSMNYVSHLGIYRRTTVQDVGGFRPGFEGSQDYDLLLRCLAHAKPEQIVHIPRVLYHWRAIPGSTAAAIGEKDYAGVAGLRALSDHLAHAVPDAAAEAGSLPGTYRVRYPVPSPEPLVSIIIPTRNMLKVLEVCVDSILKKTTYQNFEILILDNQSDDEETLGWLRSITGNPKVKVVPYDAPFNFSAINNHAVAQARGEIVALVNNDIEVISPDWLTEMVSHACRPGMGCVGAKLYYGDDTIQHAGIVLGIGGVAGHPHKHFQADSSGYFGRLQVTQQYSAVTAACMVVRKAIYDEVGGLNETDLRVAFNDVDFCIRVIRAGYRNVWTPYAELYHHESVSRGAEDNPEKQARFAAEAKYMIAHWNGILRNDPAYSPNLSQSSESFAIG